MQFHEKRRQQFLGERHWALARRNCLEGVEEVGRILREAVAEGDVRYAVGRARTISELMVDRLSLNYTAGEPIDPMRGELENVLSAYERYAELLWQDTADRNEPAFDFVVLDDYCQLMQLVGLCFLLHRRDLLPRIAALQDGENGTSNGGADVIYEEWGFMGSEICKKARGRYLFPCKYRTTLQPKSYCRSTTCGLFRVD